jgi:hypothetical protein
MRLLDRETYALALDPLTTDCEMSLRQGSQTLHHPVLGMGCPILRPQ